MEEQKTFNVNYVCTGGLLRRHFLYLDDTDFNIDDIAYKHGVKLKFLGDFLKSNSDKFIISVCSCWCWDVKKLEESVFDDLDKKMLVKHKEDYNDFIEDFLNTVNEFSKSKG